MRSVVTWCAGILFMSAGLCNTADAGNYRLAGVQADRTSIRSSVNAGGYRIRACVAPTVSKASKNTSQYRIQIGILDDSQPKRNAAELWALYE